ncbi:hypothetical protein J4Q44_G00032620 [Coregonus suidteri]|uniref:Uncharacterized protein n=1 Tax=Coregonus suidteri TaxID=861788 RepID=A0AAN8MLA2_9TELE
MVVVPKQSNAARCVYKASDCCCLLPSGCPTLYKRTDGAFLSLHFKLKKSKGGLQQAYDEPCPTQYGCIATEAQASSEQTVDDEQMDMQKAYNLTEMA